MGYRFEIDVGDALQLLAEMNHFAPGEGML